MKTHIRLVALVFSLLAVVSGTAEEITVYAAASLTNALTEIGAAHQKATGDKVIFNFAAANALARQIEAGAPADVFFSADEVQMDLLAKKDLIDKSTRRSLLGNALVIVTGQDGPDITKVADLAGSSVKRISIGNPKAVPVGVYAKSYLEKLGLWEALQPKLVPAENVRAALAVVESGNAEVGIVYKTDVTIARNVKVALEIPAVDGSKITYPVALVSDTRHSATAQKFLARLADQEAGAVFTKHGFSLLTTND